MRPVILCGGLGTRLAPLSTPQKPKPFIPLTDRQTLFEQTLQRYAEHNPPIIVGNVQHQKLISQQCRNVEITPQKVLLEAIPYGTAFAVGCALLQAKSTFEQEPIIITPSDLIIAHKSTFIAVLNEAESIAKQGKVVAFGIPATKADTRFGYIKPGQCYKSTFYEMHQFIEKPEVIEAELLIKNPPCFWNSGMFVSQPQPLLEIYRQYQPELLALCHQALRQSREGKLYLPSIDSDTFAPISFEHAIMPFVQNGFVVTGDFGWKDVGTWEAVEELEP